MNKMNKDHQKIEEAFSQAREPHLEAIAKQAYDSSSLQPEAYNYNGKGYAETNDWSNPDHHLGIETAWTDHRDARLSRINHTGIENDLKARVVVSSESGSTTYVAETDRSTVYLADGRRSNESVSDVTVVRRDANGHEVYRTTSESVALADKIGALAAKKVIESVTNDEQDKTE